MQATSYGPLGESLLAWFWAPAVLLLLAIGLGLLAERLARIDLPGSLLAPVGACGIVVVSIAVYRASMGGWVAVGACVLLAAAGYWLRRAGLRARLRPGPIGWAAGATYLMFLAPTLFAGGWTWSGFDFVNDTAFQMILGHRLMETGAQLPATGPNLIAGSSYLEYVRVYLSTHYPLGTHALYATVARATPAPIEAIYQPFSAMHAMLTTLAIGGLVRPDVRSARTAALIGFFALAPNLLYAYALQGNTKEQAVLLALASAAGVARYALDAARPAAAAAVTAVCLAAALHVYSTGGLPYMGLLAIVLGLLAFAHRGSTLRRRLPAAIVVGAVALVVASAVSIKQVIDFTQVAQGTFTGAKAHAGGPDEFGQLARGLKFGQVSGVWLGDDYRVPVPASHNTANELLIGVAFALAVIGLLLMAWRRRFGPLLLAAPVLLTIPIMEPRLSAYANGKTFAIGSSGTLVLAGMAVALGWEALEARRRWAPALVAVPALAAAAGVLLSDVYAYRATQLAPTDRMLAMRDIDHRFPRGFAVDSEGDDFAKVFMRDMILNVPLETIAPHPMYSQLGVPVLDRRADLDQYPMDGLYERSLIVQRLGADMARAPFGFRVVYRNPYYRVWRRVVLRRVVQMVPLVSLYEGAGVADCGKVSSLVAAATQRGDRIVAATFPEEVRFDSTKLHRPLSWVPHPFIPEVVELTAPGSMSARGHFRGGRYTIWLMGTSGRDIEVSVDGRRVGAVRGTDWRGAWLSPGSVRLGAGTHRVTITRPSGSLAPGSKAPSYLGPIVFRRDEPSRLISVRPSQAEKRFCGRRLDWVGLVR